MSALLPSELTRERVLGSVSRMAETKKTPLPPIPEVRDGTENALLRHRVLRAAQAHLHVTLANATLTATALTLPTLTLKAILEFGDKTKEGQLVEGVAIAWYELLEFIRHEPDRAHEIDARKWEELIAGAYERAGYDEVILTPRSGDGGKDVIAAKRGVGCIRVFDQVKAYRPGRVVTADEVRSMIGVLAGADNVSKGIMTTTSPFAPGVATEEAIQKFVPYRLELKDRNVLLSWLDQLATNVD